MKRDDIVPVIIAGDPAEGDDAQVPPEVNAVLREWNTHRTRLYLLRGLPCPLCRHTGRVPIPELFWTGVSLACSQGHGWSNPDALRADMIGKAGLRRRGKTART